MIVGERLIELRKDRRLTQQEVADELHLNYYTYSSYEREEYEASDDTKKLIADFFNVSVDYLLGLIDEPRPVREGREYLRLPPNFPEAKRAELIKYLKFLMIEDQL